MRAKILYYRAKSELEIRKRKEAPYQPLMLGGPSDRMLNIVLAMDPSNLSRSDMDTLREVFKNEPKER